MTTLRQTTMLWWHESVLGHRVRRHRWEDGEYVDCRECYCGVDI
jgi:hypothetical protein